MKFAVSIFTVFVAFVMTWFLFYSRKESNLVTIDIRNSFLGVEWSGSSNWNKIKVEKNLNHPKCQIAEAYHAQTTRDS
jgi:hypothetical protein